ncbi:hypothetical protein A2Z33_03390 [Candidatus Gottesmanbacteria bacterium RBG_16_52_11]|uniref:UDP-N-acetylmuramyl-tripeptide synthetase n=1 Tax=Candidatus Gottesmanbacteria bacterium RBG_16_52_11 TaxID=1798374 RepID=A0A1F5YVM5_9BACT|nr:MAG: hypothetical protein A2Z33_03390 [Candidatus Gottesmanbacteria bacterium RBG_16_52_11]
MKHFVQSVKNLYHLAQAVAANIYFEFPSRKLYVIGVTGTDGKTTTTSMIYHILKTAGKRVAMISTVGAFIGDNVYDVGFHVTNPAPFALQKFIREVTDSGNDYLVLEVTSHGLDQNRVWGVPFAIGVLTNITGEHLDYHGTIGEYARVKLKLLARAGAAIVNADDPESQRVLKKIPRDRIRRYAVDSEPAEYTSKSFPIATSLQGIFNRYNALAAFAACREAGIDAKIIRTALKSFRPPVGRQEIVYDEDFRIMIDFAHTPNAFANLLSGIRGMVEGKLIHVFGSAGLRDRGKRPEMGREAARRDDVIILTAEDPRSESADAIAGEIAAGFGNGWMQTTRDDIRKDTGKQGRKLYAVIPDRRDAISFAIAIARKGDLVLLTGKSHEKSINLGSGEEPWDEFAAVRDGLKGRKTAG